ncbi:cold-shock protein [Paenibacillus sp. MCAF20]
MNYTLKDDRVVPKLSEFGQRRHEPTVWSGGDGTGDDIGVIGPSISRSPIAKVKAAVDPNKLRGKVGRFNHRGFGWIVYGANDELFFHINDCPGESELYRDQRVAFDIGQDRKGKPVAINVQVIK